MMGFRNAPAERSFSEERRTYPRKRCFLSVGYSTDERSYQEFIQDISIAGVFIETRNTLPVGQNVAMTFTFPSRQESVRLDGSVTRVSSTGIGIGFTLDSAKQQDYLLMQIENM